VSGIGAKKKRPPSPKPKKKQRAKKPRERPLQLSKEIDFDTAMRGILAVRRPEKP
jgi:hypothetical protein